MTTEQTQAQPATRPSDVRSDALLALKLRNAIASKEWITAASNGDVTKYGEWQCDWYTAMREIDEEITALFNSANDQVDQPEGADRRNTPC